MKVIRVCDRAWFAIADTTGAVSTSPSPTLRLAAVDLEQYEQLGRAAGPWQIVQAGIAIDWATADSIVEREQRLAAEREARQQQHDGAWSAAYRRTHGVTTT